MLRYHVNETDRTVVREAGRHRRGGRFATVDLRVAALNGLSRSLMMTGWLPAVGA